MRSLEQGKLMKLVSMINQILIVMAAVQVHVLLMAIHTVIFTKYFAFLGNSIAFSLHGNDPDQIFTSKI